MSEQYYRRIKGKNYDRRLLDAAEKSVAGQGDGRISERDAQGLLDLEQDQNSYTEIEKRTIQYIRDHFKFTKEGDALFRATIRSWAAKRGAAAKKKSATTGTAKKTSRAVASSTAADQSVTTAAPVHGDRALLKIPVIVFTIVILLIFFLIYIIYGPGSRFTRFSRPLPTETTTIAPATDPSVETATPAPESAADEDVQNIQSLRIRFSKKNVAFDAAMTADLDRVVRYLNRNSRANIKIIGHTCNIGQPDDNQRLSLERAEAVRGYIIDHGVDAARVSAIGRGESEPIASNSSDAGRIRNRRVEFRISE